MNRPLGGQFAAVGYALDLTPAQVTASSAACSFAGLALAATVRPTISLAAAVTALLLLGYALDSADGQLARLRGGGTRAGEWLDHVVDTPKIAAVHLTVLVELVRFRGFDAGSPYLVVPLGFLLVAMTFFFGMMLRDQLMRGELKASGRPVRNGRVITSFLLLPVDYGALCLVFALLAFRMAFLVGYACLFAVNLLFAARGLRKTYRLLSRPVEGADR